MSSLAYRLAHRAELGFKQRAYAAANKDKAVEYRRSHRAEICVSNAAYHQKYYLAHKAALLLYGKNYKRTYREEPVKVAARYAVKIALRSGTLVKPNTCTQCELVTTSRRMHAHHFDYSQPLVVTWLCSLCHGKQHRKVG